MNSEARSFEIATEFVSRREKSKPISREAAREIMGKNLFGPEQWLSSYGIWFSERQIKNIADFPWSENDLDAPCPFIKGKRVKETHFAFLGIDRMYNRPLDILRWHEIHPISVNGVPKISSWDADQNFARARTCWLKWHLALIEGVPSSEGKTYQEQEDMLPDQYRFPFAIEEVTKNILYFKSHGVCLNSKKWARCQDAASGESRACIGEFISVSSHLDNNRHPDLGFSAYRKFPTY